MNFFIFNSTYGPKEGEVSTKGMTELHTLTSHCLTLRLTPWQCQWQC